MSTVRSRTRLAEFANLRGVKKAAAHLPQLYVQLVEMLMPLGESARFQETFSRVAEQLPPVEWAEQLLEHHRRIQHGKPPNGKAPWFERFDTGEYVIRPLYFRETGGQHDDSYVHGYRTGPLWLFAEDLGMVK
jgi:hypothetical protein